jgi:peptidoglycan hydrolase-like protein with peptidoglycan-binding domain
MPVIAAGGVLAVVVFAGMGGGGSSNATPGPNPGSVGGPVATVPKNTKPPVVTKVDPQLVKTHLTRDLRIGYSGPDVKALQLRLKALKFDPGPIDGQYGAGTQQAVWGFQAIVKSQRYDVQTGEVDDALWQVMQDDITFQPRRQDQPGATHMEIYLDSQAAIVFTDNKPTLLTHISSGTGARWCDLVKYDTDNFGNPVDPPVVKDQCGISKTPGGHFQFFRRYTGNREGPLGGMFNPVYFNYGIAVHGARIVPNHPASHGCIRIPEFIATYFPSLVKNGDQVWVWDGKKEPEQQSKADMLPVFNFNNPDATTTSSSTTTSSTTTTVVPTTTKPKPTTTTAKPTNTTVKSTTTVASATTTTVKKK